MSIEDRRSIDCRPYNVAVWQNEGPCIRGLEVLAYLPFLPFSHEVFNMLDPEPQTLSPIPLSLRLRPFLITSSHNWVSAGESRCPKLEQRLRPRNATRNVGNQMHKYTSAFLAFGWLLHSQLTKGQCTPAFRSFGPHGQPPYPKQP